PSRGKLVLLFMKVYWKTFVVILAPIVCLFVIFLGIKYKKEKELMCAYVVCVMACYWVTEAVSTAITALLPVFFFPFFGLLSAERACMLYFKETTIMFVGSLIVASAIELSGLHIRFALKCLLIVGTSHRMLSLGLFLVTMFVSMWITNTAATAMMTPIIFAVIQTLEEENMCQLYTHVVDPNIPGSANVPSRTTLAYFLGTAYSASIGGTGTYVGTGTNLAAREQLEASYPNDVPQFHEWMIITCPIMLINIFFLWLWINFLFLGFLWKGGCDPQVKAVLMESKEEQKKVEKTIRSVIKTKYNDLGPMSWHEIITGLVFIFCVCLWFFRSPKFLPGWADRILDVAYINDTNKTEYANYSIYENNDPKKEKKSHFLSKDAGAATFVIFLFFIIPSTLQCLRFFQSKATELPNEQGPGLMNWTTIHNKVSWGLLFVIGSGFTIAEASKVTGLSSMLGNFLKGLGGLSDYGIMFLSCLMSSLITEFTSNVAVLNIIGPVILSMGTKLKLHGPYLFVPVAVSCSYAFMLPVGTPPNALVAGLASIPTPQMIVAGSVPKLFFQMSTTTISHLIVPLLIKNGTKSLNV
ncbi:hypothetical protein L9F63_017200, partial [Diploptera punctata]